MRCTRFKFCFVREIRRMAVLTDTMTYEERQKQDWKNGIMVIEQRY